MDSTAERGRYLRTVQATQRPVEVWRVHNELQWTRKEAAVTLFKVDIYGMTEKIHGKPQSVQSTSLMCQACFCLSFNGGLACHVRETVSELEFIFALSPKLRISQIEMLSYENLSRQTSRCWDHRECILDYSSWLLTRCQYVLSTDTCYHFSRAITAVQYLRDHNTTDVHETQYYHLHSSDRTNTGRVAVGSPQFGLWTRGNWRDKERDSIRNWKVGDSERLSYCVCVCVCGGASLC